MTEKNPSLKYLIAISLIPGIGTILARKLIKFAGTPAGVFELDTGLLKNIKGIGEKLACNIVKRDVLEQADRELEFIDKYNIDAHSYDCAEYPKRLKECPDLPLVLYSKGLIDLNSRKIISIVGTRSATQYGLCFCKELIEELRIHQHFPVIVSGLAYGIDVCAHKEALKNRLPTVAVLAHGLSTIYPSAHRKLAEQIICQGALITDFPGNIMPERGNFLRRNRIIAGLADAIIVIESANKGGSLITANLGNSYNRDVFALPGRISDQKSTGCNKLIKTNQASLIESVSDLEYIMGWETPPNNQLLKDSDQSIDNLSNDERSIIKVLSDFVELTTDKISLYTGISTGKTASALLNLELLGYIHSMPGNLYRFRKNG